MAATRSLLKLLGACVLAGVLVAGVLFPVVGGAGLLSNRASDTVDSVSDELAEGRVPQISTMLDAAGNPIAYFWDQRRTSVASDEISDAMKLAIISVEDRRFYENAGVDWRGTIRAAVTNATAGQTEQGASTLTQQYVKNYLLLVVAQNDAERRAATETTPARKLREIRIALALNEQLGKDEILTRYLNIVPFGNGAYGIQQAAQTYFGVNAADLNVPQSAMLAGMVQSSSALNPYNPDAVSAVTERRNVVLNTMVETQALSRADADAVQALPLGVLPEPQSPGNGCVAAAVGDRGFFCQYAVDYLDSHGISTEDLNAGGYTIQTTLDPDLQASTKASVNQAVPTDLPRIASVMNVVQPGQDAHRVVAMASSRTYGLDGEAQQTVNPQTYTQPGSQGAGSTFKIFTVAAAMEQGLGINATLDNPQRYTATGIGSGGCTDVPNRYCVENFNDSYNSSYSVTNALAKSPNTAFVKLAEATGIPPIVDMAVKLGLRSYATTPIGPDTDRSQAEAWKAGPQGAFTLGPNDVNPLEMANVGATIASSGMWCEPTPIDSVTDTDGEPVALTASPCEQVVEPGLADTLMNAMSQDDVTGTSRGAAATVDWTLPMAGKTGTTNNFGSAAFLGFTNTLAGFNMVFDDAGTGTQEGIRLDGNGQPFSCGGPSCGNITGGSVPARTWFSAIAPVIGQFGDVALPPLDQRFVQGSGAGNVPDVTGQGSAEAASALESQGFSVSQQAIGSGASRGTVVRQSVVGVSVPGAAVTIYVSNGQSQQRRTPQPLPQPPGPQQLPTAPQSAPEPEQPGRGGGLPTVAPPGR